MPCFIRNSLLAATLLGLAGQAVAMAAKPPATPSIKQMLGQKLMLDFRYYCQQPPVTGQCRTPVTELPPELAGLIRDYDIGGVILFAENLQQVPQMVQLNRDLQQAAAKSPLRLPLFIGIDQEGGRVARLPRSLGTSFSGNMAIGATYAAHGTTFAGTVGKVLADELLALGVNVNFAPTVDVNVNPQNPVINVRAFGENPQQVAELGAAMTEAMQQQGMITALKHFPGHGDTHVDSHLGLPRVDHSAEQIRKIDLHPFAHIIASSNPGMIMTAHIQFPALDSTTFVSKDGEQMIKPATLSRTILHDVLRNELGYKGVVVTDALDMAGISHFFTMTEAVIQTFAAGADIALMPVKLQHPAELAALKQLLDALEQAVNDGVIAEQELAASYQRIVQLKQQYPLLPTQKNSNNQVRDAINLLGNAEHRKHELKLAQASITQVKPATAKWPLTLQKNSKVLLVMPDNSKAAVLANMLQHYSDNAFSISTLSLQQTDLSAAAAQIKAADVVISGFISPMQSLADIGGMDDMSGIKTSAAAYERQQTQFANLLPLIRQQQKPHVFISLRAPYDIADYGDYADVVLASYAYNTTDDLQGLDTGNAVYQALAQALLRQIELTGVLPVTIRAVSNKDAR